MKDKQQRQSILITHPELVREWDEDKNGDLSPSNFSSGSGTKIWWKCSKCGYSWQTKISHRTSNHGCPKCFHQRLSNSKRKSHQEFVEKLSIINPNIEVLSEYHLSHEKVQCKCKVCGNLWEAAPSKLMIGRSCPKCGRRKTADARRNSIEDILERLRQINPTIKVVGEYVSCDKPIECECLVCGFHWSPTISNLLAGKGCQKCSHTYRRSHREFVDEMKHINPDVIIIGQYVNTSTKISCKCSKCAYEWETTPSSLLQGSGCRNCARINNTRPISSCKHREETVTENSKVDASSYRFTNSDEVFREKVYENGKNTNIVLLETYSNSTTKVRVQCTVCGYEWKSLPNTLYRAVGCPQCNKRVKTHSYFIEELCKINPDVTVLTEYEKAYGYIECECRICGNIWSATAHSLLQGHGCPKCKREQIGNTRRKTQDQFVDELRIISPDTIVIGKYIKNNKPIECQCKNCNRIWKIRPDDLLKGRGCPNCNGFTGTSFVEQLMYVILERILGKGHVLNRSKQSIGRELDIDIPELKCAIEYGSWFWHRNKISKDRDKRVLCESQNIRLITIYDACDLEVPPFEDNCFIFPFNLADKQYSDYLKIFILELLDNLSLDHPEFEQQYDELVVEAKRRSRRRGTQFFKNELYKINPDIEILGEFHRVHEPIECRCKKCNYMWNGIPSGMLRGSGCPKCGGSYRKTHAEFVEQMNQINPNIEIISDYEGDANLVLCICKICGNEWMPSASSLIQKHGCPSCAHKKLAKLFVRTQEEFETELKLKNPDVKVIGKYINARTGVLCKCLNCSHEWRAVPDCLINRGSGCPACRRTEAAKKRRKKVMNIDLGIEYDSSTDAANDVGGRAECISAVCNGKRETAYGYHWRFIL